ncbi:hypothetical protein [Rubrivirga sp.]|uniref:hypothetical protein n=1 Tax=Rubrivirga sp. TaxID=1885344 RepID=UPI003C706A87
MQRAIIIAVLGLLVALLSLITAMFAAFTPAIPTAQIREEERQGRASYDEATLLNHMVNMQRYIEKAALSAEAENWELTQFYAEKIDERATRVIDGGYIVDGIDVSAIAAEIADPRATALAEAAATRDRARFDEAYDVMVDGCNACHGRSGYPLIQIRRPDAAAYPSQVFETPASQRARQ